MEKERLIMYYALIFLIALIILVTGVIGISLYQARKRMAAKSQEGSKAFVLALRKSNNSIGDNECVAQALEILKEEGFEDFECYKK